MNLFPSPSAAYVLPRNRRLDRPAHASGHSRSTRPRRVVTAGLSLALVATILILAVSSPRASAAPSEDVQAWLDDVSASGVPAMAVVVTRGDHVEVETGAGQVDGHPVDEHTPFRIASLSKSFTATAVMQLVEEKRVDLDSPAAQYLPGLRLNDGRTERITSRFESFSTSPVGSLTRAWVSISTLSGRGHHATPVSSCLAAAWTLTLGPTGPIRIPIIGYARG